MSKGSRTHVRDDGPGVGGRQANPAAWAVPSPNNALHRNLTPADREAIQDWMARRYLQLHEKGIGRRRTDLPMPASVRSASQAERFTNYIRRTTSPHKR
jgi:hypothetical protein